MNFMTTVKIEDVPQVVADLSAQPRTDTHFPHPFFHELVHQNTYVPKKPLTALLRAFPIDIKADLSVKDKYTLNVIVRARGNTDSADKFEAILQALAFNPATQQVDKALINKWLGNLYVEEDAISFDSTLISYVYCEDAAFAEKFKLKKDTLLAPLPLIIRCAPVQRKIIERKAKKRTMKSVKSAPKNKT